MNYLSKTEFSPNQESPSIRSERSREGRSTRVSTSRMHCVLGSRYVRLVLFVSLQCCYCDMLVDMKSSKGQQQYQQQQPRSMLATLDSPTLARVERAILRNDEGSHRHNVQLRAAVTQVGPVFFFFLFFSLFFSNRVSLWLV